MWFPPVRSGRGSLWNAFFFYSVFERSLFFQTTHIGIYCMLIHVDPNSSGLAVNQSYKSHFHDNCLKSQPTYSAEQHMHQYSLAVCLHLLYWKKSSPVFFDFSTCSEYIICFWFHISLLVLLPTSSLDHISGLRYGNTVSGKKCFHCTFPKNLACRRFCTKNYVS